MDVVSEIVGQGKPLSLGEISAGGGIEQVSDNDFTKSVIELEAFMNEVLTIIVQHDNTEGALDVIVPNVNGMNQPIVRGVKTQVRRKYVEALARSRNTKYVQRRVDPDDPASLRMVPVVNVAYPFTVINDPNPNGTAWLEAIAREQ